MDMVELVRQVPDAWNTMVFLYSAALKKVNTKLEILVNSGKLKIPEDDFEKHVKTMYLDIAKTIYNKFSGLGYIAHIVVLFIAVFMISIILDKIRIVCFNYLWNKYEIRKH